MINKSHIVFITSILILIPIPKAQSENSKWVVGKATILAQEYSKKHTDSYVDKYLNGESNQAKDVKGSKLTSCDPVRLSSIIFSLKRGESSMVIQKFYPCNEPVTSLKLLEKPIHPGGVVHDGRLFVNGNKYFLLDADINVKTIPKSEPLKYQVSFKTRFSSKENRQRLHKGLELNKDPIFTETGVVLFEPDFRCNSEITGYSFDSREQEVPDPVKGNFCFSLFGVQAPPAPKPQPTKTPSP